MVNGSKTFITNGINADLVITAVEDRSSASGTPECPSSSLERGWKGFERGRNLEKIGQHAQDTAELFFTDVPSTGRGTSSEGEGQGLQAAGPQPTRKSGCPSLRLRSPR